MPKSLTEAHALCKEKGFLIAQAGVDTKKIRSNLKLAEEDLASAHDAVKSKRWNSAYKLYYDVLHVLVESYLCFDKVKSANHQCLFVYLCMNHPELDLSWDFFETRKNPKRIFCAPKIAETIF